MRWFSHVRVSFSQSVMPSRVLKSCSIYQDFFPQSSECLGIFTKLKGIFQEFSQSGKVGQIHRGLYKGPLPNVFVIVLLQ